jgi:N-acetylglutamate synthase-like GNAT family acetyltransferase
MQVKHWVDFALRTPRHGVAIQRAATLRLAEQGKNVLDPERRVIGTQHPHLSIPERFAEGRCVGVDPDRAATGDVEDFFIRPAGVEAGIQQRVIFLRNPGHPATRINS